jgi:hypothetical protein
MTTPAKDKPEDLDSLGQDNPARELEKKNIKEAKEKQEKADKEAKKEAG